jgi:hypothetical protein
MSGPPALGRTTSPTFQSFSILNRLLLYDHRSLACLLEGCTLWLNYESDLLGVILVEDEVFSWFTCTELLHSCVSIVESRGRFKPDRCVVVTNSENIVLWDHDCNSPYFCASRSR